MSENLHSVAEMGRSPLAPTVFAMLPPELRAALRAAAPRRRFARGAIIQQRGDFSTGFWLIERGQVAVGQYLEDGTFRAIAVLGPGDSYGELALLAGRARVVDAVAKRAAELLWIDGPGFERALASDPASMRALIGALAAGFQETIDILANLRRGTAHIRIASLLERLADPAGEVTVTQQELAELAGVTRATTNAVLRDFEAEGLIARGYGRIAICDREGLAEVR